MAAGPHKAADAVAAAVAHRLQAFPLLESGTAAPLLSWRTAGHGTPLVLLHGISGGSGSWLPQLESLADTFRVIAWDAPGYGTSALPADTTPTVQGYVDALAGLIDRLAVERCLLVGQSLGALIGTAFARAFPARLQGLILLGPARGYGDAPPAKREEVLRGRLESMAKLGPDGMAVTRARALLGTAPADDAIALVASSMRALRPDGFGAAARLLTSHCLPDDAAYVDLPVAVGCGTADTITPEPGCRTIAGAFATHTYQSIPEAGHASNIDRPAAINALIRTYAAQTGVTP